jgi:hypothetical protein
MLNLTVFDQQHALASKVRHAELQRSQDYSMSWAFLRLRSLAIEITVLQAARLSALCAFFDRCCTLSPPNITLYDVALGSSSR